MPKEDYCLWNYRPRRPCEAEQDVETHCSIHIVHADADMGDAGNQELLRYFQDRRAWRVGADDPAPKLKAYGIAPPN